MRGEIKGQIVASPRRKNWPSITIVRGCSLIGRRRDVSARGFSKPIRSNCGDSLPAGLEKQHWECLFTRLPGFINDPYRVDRLPCDREKITYRRRSTPIVDRLDEFCQLSRCLSACPRRDRGKIANQPRTRVFVRDKLNYSLFVRTRLSSNFVVIADERSLPADCHGGTKLEIERAATQRLQLLLLIVYCHQGRSCRRSSRNRTVSTVIYPHFCYDTAH